MLLVGLFVQVTCFFATLSNCTLQKWQVLISAILEGSKYYFQDSKEPCIRHSCMQHTVSRETSFKDPSAPFFNVIHEMDQDLKKVPSYCPGQVHADFHSGQTIMFSFSLAQWARDQASHLPWTKSLKEQTTWFAQGKQNLRRYLS